jgi:hypothetical protein
VTTPGIRARIPAHYLGDTVAGAPGAIDQLVSSRRPAPTVAPTPEHAAARAHFTAVRPIIDADALANLPCDALPSSDATTAARWMALGLDAALALGDLSFLDAEVTWAAGQPPLARLGPEVLGLFVVAYARAAERHLDRRGRMIAEWLRGTAARLARAGSE